MRAERPTGAGTGAVEARNDSVRQQDIKRIKRQAHEKLAELGLDEAHDPLSSPLQENVVLRISVQRA
jgi:hypothetical protein